MERGRILCIVGPTACHKTETAVLLAWLLNGEVVSADSVQVYRGMDIGSAKPTVEERQGIPHHMLDCVPVDTPAFSVSAYREMAYACIEDILARGRLPIIVGGSGLYVQALVNPLDFAVPRDDGIREELNAAYDASPEAVFLRLQECDPVTAERLHRNDKKRVVRALEVFSVSGKPLSAYGNDFANAAGKDAPYETAMIGLTMERKQLYTRINTRVDLMLQQGLLAEAERIYHAGYDRSLPAMQSIGYRQLFSYFDGACTLPEAVAQIKLDTRHFAKRQMTWFLRDPRIRWFDVGDWNDETTAAIVAAAKEMTAYDPHERSGA